MSSKSKNTSNSKKKVVHRSSGLSTPAGGVAAEQARAIAAAEQQEAIAAEQQAAAAAAEQARAIAVEQARAVAAAERQRAIDAEREKAIAAAAEREKAIAAAAEREKAVAAAAEQEKAIERQHQQQGQDKLKSLPPSTSSQPIPRRSTFDSFQSRSSSYTTSVHPRTLSVVDGGIDVQAKPRKDGTLNRHGVQTEKAKHDPRRVVFSDDENDLQGRHGLRDASLPLAKVASHQENQSHQERSRINRPEYAAADKSKQNPTHGRHVQHDDAVAGMERLGLSTTREGKSRHDDGKSISLESQDRHPNDTGRYKAQQLNVRSLGRYSEQSLKPAERSRHQQYDDISRAQPGALGATARNPDRGNDRSVAIPARHKDDGTGGIYGAQRTANPKATRFDDVEKLSEDQRMEHRDDDDDDGLGGMYGARLATIEYGRRKAENDQVTRRDRAIEDEVQGRSRKLDQSPPRRQAVVPQSSLVRHSAASPPRRRSIVPEDDLVRSYTTTTQRPRQQSRHVSETEPTSQRPRQQSRHVSGSEPTSHRRQQSHTSENPRRSNVLEEYGSEHRYRSRHDESLERQPSRTDSYPERHRSQNVDDRRDSAYITSGERRYRH